MTNGKNQNFQEIIKEELIDLLGDPRSSYNKLQLEFSEYINKDAGQKESIRFPGGIHWREEIGGTRMHLDVGNSMTLGGVGNILFHIPEALLSDKNSFYGIFNPLGNMLRPWAPDFYRYRTCF